MNFQRITAIIAVVLLVIVLIFIGVSLAYAKPSAIGTGIAQCPDYWTINDDNKCVNVQDLGTCKAASGTKHLTLDFLSSSGYNTMCAKYNWAKGCGIVWDGITNKDPSPCATA